MYVQYGTGSGAYKHGRNEASITYTNRRLYSEWRGYHYAQEVVMTVQGELSCNHPTLSISQQLDALIAAYSVDGKDLVLYTDANVATQHKITSSMGTIIDGPRVTKFDFPVGDFGEYVSHRTYFIEVYAQYRYYDTNDPWPGIVRYQESIRYIGNGGPAVVLVPDQSGNEIQRQLWPSTPITMLQSGESIGQGGYALPLPAVEPLYLRNDKAITTYSSPTFGSRGTKMYGMEWVFPMEIPASLAIHTPVSR
jgi:hypothetical protein